MDFYNRSKSSYRLVSLYVCVCVCVCVSEVEGGYMRGGELPKVARYDIAHHSLVVPCPLTYHHHRTPQLLC